MRWLPIALVLVAASSGVRADESDDALAIRLGRVVLDPRADLRSRVEAAKLIGKIGPRASAATPHLDRALRRLRGPEQEPLQEAIVYALGLIGSPARDSLPTLARTNGRSVDIDQAIKQSTDLILAASDSEDVNALVRQLSSRDPSVRLRGVKALGVLGPAARFAVPDLITALGDNDPDVRRAAVVALRLIQPDVRPNVQVARAVALDLSDPDPSVRLLAIRALSRMGPVAGAVASSLEPLLNDPDPDIRKAAADAMSRIGGP